MPVPVKCACGQRFSAPDHLAGKRVKCPKCQQPLSIPAAASPQAAPSRPDATTEGPAAPQKLVVQCACGHRFKAPRELAGRAVKCPSCTQPVRVASAAGGQEKPAARAARTNSSGQAAAAGRRPAKSADRRDGALIAGLLDEVGVEASRTGARCPECRADIDPEAVLCVECGFHLEKKKKLETIMASQRKQSKLRFSSSGGSGGTAAKPTPPEVEQVVKTFKALAYVHIALAVIFTLVQLYPIYQAAMSGAARDTTLFAGLALFLLLGIWIGVGLAAGLYLLSAGLISNGSRGGWILGVVLSAISLFSFPIGTLVGVLLLRGLLSPPVKNWCK